MLAILACALALAETPPSTAQSLQEFHRSVSDLEVLGDLYRRVGREPVRIVDGPLTIELRSGWMVPIFSGRFAGEWEQEARSILRRIRADDPEAELPTAELRGDKQLVGFVWTGGEGTVEVRLDDRADALIFANRMVADVGYDEAAFADVAHGRAPFRTTLGEGIFLSIDPALERAFLADAAETSPDPFEVIVYGERGGDAAARRAEALFAQRVGILDEIDVELGEWIAWDRVAEVRGLGDATGAHGLIDLRTGHRYGLVQLGPGKEAAGDEWLTLLRDETGERDVRRRSQLLSIGRTAGGALRGGRIGGEVFPPSDGDPTSHPAPPVRFEPDFADATVRVRPTANGLDLAVHTKATLRLRAVGGPLQWATLVFPRVEAVPGSWELVSATMADGRPIVGDRPLVEEAGEARDDDGDAADPRPPEPRPAPEPEPEPEPIPEDPTSRVRVLLPEPVAPGEVVEIVVETRDTWPLANWRPCGSAIADRPMGPSSGLQSYLPALGNGFSGSPWRFRTAVGVPEDSRLQSSISGDSVQSWTERGVAWQSAEHTATTALWANVAVGAWRHHLEEPAKLGFPSVLVHLHTNRDNTIATFAPEARRVIEYFQRWLPPFPWSEIEVFEAPMGCGGYAWIAPHAMVNVQRMIVQGDADGRITGHSIDNDKPHLEHGTFAHELAHQYWGHVARPANTEDFWIAETFAETFACMYVGAAFGPKDCDVRLKTARERWEQKVAGRYAEASLPGAYASPYRGAIVYQYGPYVMLHMLRARIGIEAFHAALDILLRDHPQEPLTTERLQRYFELASGQDLSGFFDFWVHQGRIPALELAWSQGPDGRVSGTVRSDVPFGRFDVPVRFEHRQGGSALLVDVVDGEGSFTSEPMPAGTRVALDPDGLVLARARKTRR